MKNGMSELLIGDDVIQFEHPRIIAREESLHRYN